MALSPNLVAPFAVPPAPGGPGGSPALPGRHDEGTTADAAPSRQELLERAARLGPARATFASFSFLSADPILRRKMQPTVVARRARLRKLVKATVGVCVAFCLIATAASALSSSSTARESKPSVPTKTVPASAVVPVEKLETITRSKAPRTPNRLTAARPGKKRVKRR